MTYFANISYTRELNIATEPSVKPGLCTATLDNLGYTLNVYPEICRQCVQE